MSRVIRALATAVLALSVAARDPGRAAPGRGAGPDDRGLRAVPAAEEVRAEGQARHQGAGPLARQPRRRPRPDRAALPERRHVRAQGRPRVRLDPRRRKKKDRLVAQDFLRYAFATDARWQRARDRPPDGDHVHHLERPHVLRVGPVRAGALPQLELQEAEELLAHAAAPQPRPHLAGRPGCARADELVRRPRPLTESDHAAARCRRPRGRRRVGDAGLPTLGRAAGAGGLDVPDQRRRAPGRRRERGGPGDDHRRGRPRVGRRPRRHRAPAAACRRDAWRPTASSCRGRAPTLAWRCGPTPR